MNAVRMAARRGGWHPVGAHTGAVGLAGRLPCDARSAVAPHNSLRSLRSLRSDKCGESVHEARAAHAPTTLLRFSAPHKSPPPGTTHRAASLVVFLSPHATVVPAKARAGCRRSAYAQPRRRAGTQAVQWTACALRAARPLGLARPARPGLAGRARSAPQALTRGIWPNAANEVSAVSYAAGLQARASQGTLAQRGQASKRSRLPARAFARVNTPHRASHAAQESH